MHRGHLDPAVATMPATPEDSKRVIKYWKDLLDFARSENLPVVHVILIHRNIPGFGSEAMKVGFSRAGAGCPFRGRPPESRPKVHYYNP